MPTVQIWISLNLDECVYRVLYKSINIQVRATFFFKSVAQLLQHVLPQSIFFSESQHWRGSRSKMVRFIALAALCISLCQSAAVPVNHAVHEKRDITPDRWVKRDRLHWSATLPVHIGLTQSNLERGYEFIMDVCVMPLAFEVFRIEGFILNMGQCSSRIFQLWKALVP